ncbi:LysR substrate-binding domain-containing protein [Mucilaginibacter sp. FT3.2]|uniref:LysR substrate-binding domain-containing protein n=1 Tax=Mucilaginibacter sp. FT3.2 TaxID=2723090 RepID=UPI001613CAA7|nr:LysR substrate-binding domain-containing protein [Mucilaginibacter sp. FT3.2]MBB6231110.1 DNA-binding transcriptional LysR family regulator [Mucilaginibacter sp. FT3.2]
MDLRHLNYFIVLAEELHFGRAAERLHISQPPLTRMIKQIEDSFGVSLFERTKRKVSLTLAGEELLVQTRQMITQMETIKKRLKIIGKGDSGMLRIGYVGATMHSSLPKLISSFVAKYPDIYFNLDEQPNLTLLHSLSNGIIDIAFVRSWLHPKNLEEKLILKEPFVLVVPQEHPLAKCDHIEVKDLQNETFIMFSRDCGPTIYDSFLALCTKAGFVPDILHQATQFNSVLRLVESGFGISLLPVSIAQGYSLKLKFVPIVNCDESIPLIMLYRKDSPNPSLKHLINHFNN